MSSNPNIIVNISIEKLKLEFGIKIACFVLHFCVSQIILGFLFACDTQQFNQYMYKNQAYSYKDFLTSSIRNVSTCKSEVSCFRDAIPWGNQYKMDGFYWNVYSILFVVEWITTSMSLSYLKKDLDLVFKDNKSSAEQGNNALYFISVAWNCIGWAIYCMYFMRYTQNNMLEFFIVMFSFGVSTLILIFYHWEVEKWILSNFGDKDSIHTLQAQVMGKIWNIPTKFLQDDSGSAVTPLLPQPTQINLTLQSNVRIRAHIFQRYLEYACTAPLLFIDILCVMVVGPPFWAFMVAYTCILSCCLFAIPLHIMHMEEKIMPYITGVPPPPKDPPALTYSVIPTTIDRSAPPPANVVNPTNLVDSWTTDTTVVPTGPITPSGSASFAVNPGGSASYPVNSGGSASYLVNSGGSASYPVNPGIPTPTYDLTSATIYPTVTNPSVLSPGMNRGSTPAVITTPDSPLYDTLIQSTRTRQSAGKQAYSKLPVINVPIQRLGVYTPSSQTNYIHNYNQSIKDYKTGPINVMTSMVFMGKWHSHWTCKFTFMQLCVYSLMMALAILIYLGRDLLTTSILPLYVTYALWNLIIMYSIFGVVGFMYYYILDSLWESMDTAYDILSLLSKVPIALALCGGYLNMPGNTCNPRV